MRHPAARAADYTAMSAPRTDRPVRRWPAATAWLVGGAVRDGLLGRDDRRLRRGRRRRPAEAPRARSAAAGGRRSSCPEAFGAWRVVARDRAWQVDVSPLPAATLEADLAPRDLTINAIAEPLAGGEPFDPFGGLDDLARAAAADGLARSAFAADPLRTLRLARLACELDLEVDPPTAERARAHAAALADVAAERVFAELSADRRRSRARRARADGRLGLIDAVLPELPALRGVEQSRYHHLDVHDHTLAVLDAAIALERDPRRRPRDRAPAGAGRCSPSRWPTSSRAARRCASGRCCTTSPSPRRAR